MAGNMIVRQAFVGLDGVSERIPTRVPALTLFSVLGSFYHLMHLASHSGIDAMPD